MTKPAYIQVQCNGSKSTDPEIIVSLYGSRGGLVTCQSLDLANAALLRDGLIRAIKELEAAP